MYTQHSIGKDKYLYFQLDWHKYCSVFLLPKESNVGCVFDSPPKNLREIESVRQLWLNFCDGYQEQINCNKVMILLTSAVYNVLLEQVHTCNTLDCSDANSPTECRDGDDVYARFGGATLCSMLHLRYKDIKRCNEGKRDIISKEIDILHSINTKNKASMPQYLQYRDNGYMYTPHPTFIPFFRAVDECTKEIVNQKGLQEHGNELVKVRFSLIMTY